MDGDPSGDVSQDPPCSVVPVVEGAAPPVVFMRLARSYGRDVARAREEGANQETLDAIQHGYWAESDALHQELEELRTSKLLRKANRPDVHTRRDLS